MQSLKKEISMSKYLRIVIICFVLVPKCIAISDSNLPYKEGELLVRFAPIADGIYIDTSDSLVDFKGVGRLKWP